MYQLYRNVKPIFFVYHFHRDFQAKKKKKPHDFFVVFTPYSGMVSPNDKTINEISMSAAFNIFSPK